MKKTRAHFPKIKSIAFEGTGSRNPLAFRHYNPDEVVDGKTMRDHLRFSVAYWHAFRGTGADPFGLHHEATRAIERASDELCTGLFGDRK